MLFGLLLLLLDEVDLEPLEKISNRTGWISPLRYNGDNLCRLS
jgi:hypothetical protein